ncbi:MAG: serine/threonine-protein kinase [Thermoanaerobaculales bacterium]|jgi:tetratricopeptide (TPR) repeat protein|nr:serine/threonine-protein kinase [Thermoanaerobaculales bacterium]
MVAADRDSSKDSQVATRVTGDPAPASASRRPDPGLADTAELVEVSRDHYEIEGELGRGGMGRVMVGRDRRLGRTVAVKELLAGTVSGLRTRFIREALLTSRLQHPAIVPVYEAGRWPEGEPFYAMKLVEGRTLDELLRGARDLSGRLALLPHLITVAEAVAFAHDRRVVHRDLKPSNVLVGDFGETVVVDWGLARDLGGTEDEAGDDAEAAVADRVPDDRTVAGTILGTPHFMAPEQARGEPVDERADVWALGAMLYFLLAGAPPHAGSSGREALVAAADGEVEPVERLAPAAPPELVAVVAKAMASARDDRYPDAGALAADLRRFATGQLVSVHRYTTGELLRRFVRRHRAEVVVATVLTAVLVLAVVVGFVAVRRQARAAEAERDRAEQVAAYLEGMLSSADPRLLELGPEATVVDVLDAASARVGEELADHPEVRSRVLTTLGTTYEGLGMVTQATTHLRAALEATRVAHGPESVEVAQALHRLAMALAEQGDFEDAERLDREALATLERVGLVRSAKAAQVTSSLASILRWLGRDVEAERLFRDAVTIQRGLGDAERESLAVTLNNLAVLLGDRGDWAAAEPLAREALDIVRSVHGGGHPEVAAAMDTLGAVLEETGDLAGAEALYRDGLATRERLLGAEHPDTARSLYALANVQLARGDAEGALASCLRILSLRGQVLPDAHPFVAATLQTEGLSLLDLDRPVQAERAFRESLELRRASLPPGHWLVASSESALGASLTAQGRYGEAEAMLVESYDLLLAGRGPAHRITRDAASRLSDLYRLQGRADDAAVWAARAAGP